FFVISINETLSMWMGETEKHLANLFSTARSGGPTVIFLDEVDALGAKRSECRAPHTRWMVSQLLVEMDGISSKNDKVLVLGATNAPWDVDPALRRPGRFDRVLFVPPPDPPARSEILKLHSRGRKIDPALNWAELAKKTDLYSGADLNNLVERATERALADALKSGSMRDVTGKDFLGALKDCRPSTLEWLRRSRNYVAFANQDGLYDDLARYLEEARIK
ncbi:MAG: ATP-binding protein, partial [Candidatus Eremiobacterota bacterium]